MVCRSSSGNLARRSLAPLPRPRTGHSEWLLWCATLEQSISPRSSIQYTRLKRWGLRAPGPRSRCGLCTLFRGRRDHRASRRSTAHRIRPTKAKPREDSSTPPVDLAIPLFGYQNHVSIDRRFGSIRRWRPQTPLPMRAVVCAKACSRTPRRNSPGFEPRPTGGSRPRLGRARQRQD